MVGDATQLVGRDLELTTLASAIETERPVAVIGEAGIGKTSLVRAAASAAGVHVHEGGGFATLLTAPYLALGRAMDAPLTGDAASVAAQVERRVGPDLLFIDDLQWVDQESIAALDLLAGRILLVAAIRGSDPRTEPALDVARRLHLDILRLDGLDDDAATEVVRRVRPDLRPAAVADLIARSGGNPLVLEEMAGSGEPSPVLARAIEAGLRSLTADARDLVDLLAVADRPLDRGRLGPGLSEAIEQSFVVDRETGVTIRHALIAERVRDSLDDHSRATLHERVAGLVDDPVEAARHLIAAGRHPDAATAAGAALTVVTDPTTRAALLVIVAEASDPADDDGPRLAAARALDGLSDHRGVIAVLGGADGVASPIDRVEREVLLAHASFGLGRADEARALLDQADAEAVDASGPVAARRAVERATLLVNVDGDIEAAIAILGDALDAQEAGAPGHVAVRSVLESMRLMAAMDVDTDYLRGVVEGSLAAGLFASAADMARVIAFALLVEEGAEACLAFLADMGRRFDAAGASVVALGFLAESVQAAILAGRPVEALTVADEFLERPAPVRPRQTVTIFRARAMAMIGDLDGATDALTELEPSVTSDFVGRGWLLWTQADIAFWGGTPERAIETVGAVLDVVSPIRGAYTLPGLTRAWAEFDAGVEPRPVTGIVDTRIQAGAPEEVAGLGLLFAGDAAGAADRFAEAAALWARYDVPRELHCRWAEGEALRRAGRLDAAAPRLEATLHAVEARRFEVLAVRVRRSMRQAGLRVAPAPSLSRPAGIALTRRERELVDLVGRGLTNIEIARRMGLGRPTVARILSNAMAKLGAETRAQAVALAASREERPVARA